MRCVVTGGSGFIGSHIVEYLGKEGNEVLIYDTAMPPPEIQALAQVVPGDVRDWPLLCDTIAGADEVYHCCSLLGTSELLSRPITAFDINVGGTINVLEACLRGKVSRLLVPTKPNEWRNVYSISKHAAEQCALMYYEAYGLQVTALKWFNAYGARQHWWPIRKAIPLFILEALSGRPLTVFGSGNQLMDMIYVKDVARIAVEILRQGFGMGRVLDVGTAMPMAVIDIAREIVSLTDSESTIVHLPMRSGEPDMSQIRATVDFPADYNPNWTKWSIGLEETISFYATISKEERNRVLDAYNVPKI